MKRPQVLELLNEALSHEYHSFIGHALNSNPYVKPEWEKDLGLLERLRADENANARAILLQLGRYRAGPTVKAFHLWKEDLNFLSLEWLVIRAAVEAKKSVARMTALCERTPDGDHEMRATFRTIVETKERALAELETIAAVRATERDARRAVHHAATKTKLPAAPKPSAAKPAAGAPSAPSAPGAPRPPGAPKPPGAPAPPGAPRAPGAPSAPSAPSAPRPPGAPTPPGAPKPPGAPTPPSAPSAPSAPKPPGPPALPKPPGPPAPPRPPSA